MFVLFGVCICNVFACSLPAMCCALLCYLPAFCMLSAACGSLNGPLQESWGVHENKKGNTNFCFAMFLSLNTHAHFHTCIHIYTYAYAHNKINKCETHHARSRALFLSKCVELLLRLVFACHFSLWRHFPACERYFDRCAINYKTKTFWWYLMN